MTEQEFYEEIYKMYCQVPLAAQIRKQSNNIVHLKLEIAKLRKKVAELSKLIKED